MVFPFLFLWRWIFFEVDQWVCGGYFWVMKYVKCIAVGLICIVLPSCSLAQSALRIPSSLMQAVVRTAGLNVNHEEVPKTEVERQEEEAGKIY